MNYYKTLYKEECHQRPVFPIKDNFSNLDANARNGLTEPVTMGEVKMALFDMGPCKASGSDGFPAIFFQSHWNLLGNQLLTFVKGVLSKDIDLAEVNKTFIVPVPKIDNPDCMKQFRPIGLCNVIYKVVAKVIVNKIKNLLLTLVSPNQSSFMPGSHITDNIIVAEEIIHSMRCLKGRRDLWPLK